MNKIYLILSFVLLFFSLPFGKGWRGAAAYSQNITVEIDGDNLSYTEPGCSDCWFDPDPSFRVRATTSNGTYNWNVDEDEACGWIGATNSNWVAPQTQLATSSISISMDGWESDGGICGADDNVCGGYSTIGSVVINSNPPCQWNYNTYQRSCGSGTYAVNWSYYWYYQTVLPGSIAIDDSICAGGDPDSLTNITAGSTYATYQWQYSDDNGSTWNDIIAATGLSYDPPAGLINTRWYRRKASSCGGVPDTFTNVVIITVFDSPTSAFTFSNMCLPDSTLLTNTSINPTMGSIASWSWDFGDGTPLNTTVWSPSHLYAAPGNYPITLITYSSNLGCPHTLLDTITVFDPPTSIFTFNNLCFQDSALFTNTSLNPTMGSTAGWSWNFGDGTPLNTTVWSPSHLYAAPGNYQVTLITYSSNLGCPDTLLNTITVSDPPVSAFSFGNTCLPDSSLFTNTSLSPTMGSIAGWSWDFGDGTPLNTTVWSPSHLYASPGNYQVTLITNSSNLGCPDTLLDTISVFLTPTAIATPVSQTFCSGDTTSITLSSNVSGTNFFWTVFLSGVTGGTLGSDSAMLSQSLTTTGTTPGTAVYTITPSANGCSGTPVNATITVNPLDNASFTFTSATYCQSGTNPTPTITGLPGGTFSSTPPGLSINPSTGIIDLATSTLGAYTLSYTTNGTCQNTSSITMTITNITPSAVFSYSGSPFCQNGTNPFPIYDVGASAGIFSAIPAGLVFAHVNTGEIDLSASAPGSYTVTNYIPASGSCLAVSAITTVTIIPADDASFIYPSATYCTSGTNQTPTITGLPGGIFSATPSGLSLNPATGTIDLSTSVLGAYTLSYTTNGACPNTSSITMTITNTTPAANFSYVGSPFCQNAGNPFPLFVIGASAGVFSAAPAGLAFVHVNTGEIDLSASTPGTYTVTNTIPASGTCAAATATTTITINPADDASFLYSSATYCISGTNQTPVITGLSGGVFSSTPIGLSLNPSTGTIDLSTSALGAYTLSYATNGACPNTSSITMTIDSITPSAMFSYPTPSFCQNGNNPLPVFAAGASAGIFSATPGGLVFVNLNTGEIDLASSTPGSYTIINTIPASGTCNAVSASTTLTINPADDASFTYTSATYCQSGTPQTPTITGLPGGTYSSVPSGLSINPVTGAIDLATSALGAYTLSYTTNGACPNTSSITMTITNTTPIANFSYAGSPFCQNTGNPFPTFGSGASAGIFSATPVGLVFAHVNTGEIDLASSAPGIYTVTNNIPASGTCSAVSATATVIINPLDDASFVYSSATYCTSGTNPIPAITGLPGGIFSSTPPGLSLTPSTGEINLSASTLGAYTLSYSTNGACANTSSITMTITNITPAAAFSYSSVSFCQNGTNPLPIFGAGASAGIFSAVSAGLTFIHVNTGEIDLASSTPGTYTVTNTIPVSGTCAAVSATTTVIITPSDDASFTYSSATYCTSGSNPTPIITGLSGGVFLSTPAGLAIDSLTGMITLSTSIIGNYALSYSTFGACPNTSSIIMTITDTTPSANFSYQGSPFCQNSNNPFPAFGAGASAGIFSATPAGLVFAHVNTGEIDLASSTAGTYTITNTIPASGTCLATSATTTVIINPSPVITATPAFQNICTGATTSIVLASSIGVTNTAWTIIQTGAAGATTGAGPIITQTLTIAGTSQGFVTYIITSNSNGCIGTPITVDITVNPFPVADTTAVIIIPANCGDTTGGIAGITLVSGQAPFQYQWYDAGGAAVGTNPDLSNVSPGVFTLIVVDTNGCSINVGSFTVPATPPIIALFTANPVTGETPLTVNFTNNSIGATNYLWQFGTGDTSNVINPAYIYIPMGASTVCLTAISATGCIDTACAIIDIYLNSVFIIPNIFTPNEDNINDIFTVQGIGLTTMDAAIYNRWGEKQFVWHTVNGGWNGRSASGVPASAGTYYYIITAKGIDGKEYFEKGFFNLVR